MAFRGGRGRGRGGLGFQRQDIQLADDENVSDVPVNFPPCGTMPGRFDEAHATAPEMQRLMARSLAGCGRRGRLLSFSRTPGPPITPMAPPPTGRARGAWGGAPPHVHSLSKSVTHS